MKHACSLCLILAFWLAPLGIARADFFSLLERGSTCQPATILMLTHLGGGGVFPLWTSRYPSASANVQYSLEAGTALQCALPGKGLHGLMLFPEIGYSWTAAPVDMAPAVETHLARVGVGVGVGNQWANVVYVPRVVLGSRNSDVAVGLRHGVIGRFLYNALSVELSHQFLSVGGVYESDVRLLASLNAVIVMLLVAAAAK